MSSDYMSMRPPYQQCVYPLCICAHRGPCLALMSQKDKPKAGQSGNTTKDAGLGVDGEELTR